MSKRRRPPKRQHRPRRPRPTPGRPCVELDPDQGLRITDWREAARFVGAGHGDADAVRVTAAIMAMTIVDRLRTDPEHRAVISALAAAHGLDIDVDETVAELDGPAGTDAVVGLCRWAVEHNVDLFPGPAR